MKIIKSFSELKRREVLDRAMTETFLEFQQTVKEMTELKKEMEFEVGAIFDLRKDLEKILETKEKC